MGVAQILIGMVGIGIAFAIFRLAAISQGVYKRGLDGNASSANAATVLGSTGIQSLNQSDGC